MASLEERANSLAGENLQLSTRPPYSTFNSESMVALQKHQTFETFADFKIQLHKWAVQDGFTVKFTKSDRSRCLVQCQVSPNCTFRILAVWKAIEEQVVIIILNAVHKTCLGLAPPKRDSASQFLLLRDTVPKIITITQHTKPKEIQAAMLVHHNSQISYSAAYKVLQHLKGRDIETERSQFHVLPQYMDVLRRADGNGRFHLSYNEESNRFQRMFICPSSSRNLYKLSPQLVAADGTFTKSKFRQTLLFAVGIDGDNRVILLGWALVESENESSWEYFLYNLIRYSDINQTTYFNIPWAVWNTWIRY